MVSSSSTSPDLPIAQDILQEAALWLTSMQEAPLSEAEHSRFNHWRSQSEAHQRAWRRAERVLDKIGSLPPELAHPTLRRSTGTGRRRALQSMVALLLAAPVGWQLWRHQPWRDWLAADYVALAGQLQHATLGDGSQIALNADTEVDVYFAANERLLRLRKGELYISTAKDQHQPARPFFVQSAQGRMLALGTRFSVRQLDGATLLAVYEGAVQVQPLNGLESDWQTVPAGQQLRFGSVAIGAMTPASESQAAWRNGMLVADNMPLLQWTQELARYSGKTFRVAPSVQGLHISGAFPTQDLPRALRMLADSHGVTAKLQGASVSIGY